MGILEEIKQQLQQQSIEIAMLRQMLSNTQEQNMMIGSDEIMHDLKINSQQFHKTWKSKMPFLVKVGNRFKARRFDYLQWKLNTLKQ